MIWIQTAWTCTDNTEVFVEKKNDFEKKIGRDKTKANYLVDELKWRVLHVLLYFSLTVKAAPHAWVIRNCVIGLP